MKSKTTRKLLAALLSCSIVASALMGCGIQSGENETTGATEAPTSAPTTAGPEETSAPEQPTEEAFDPRSIAEGVKITIAAPEKTKIADYNTNETTLLIEEALGVDLEFITYPESDYATKVNVQVMSGEKMPDIIFSPGAGYTQWVDEGAVLELSKYYEDKNFSKYFWEAAERCNMDILSYLKLADGNVYGLPYLLQDPGSEVQQKLWVYKPWIDALGIEMPETTEEFYNYCKLVSQTDLNGNGKNDEIGLSGYGIKAWFDVLMSAFVYAHDGDEFLIVEDGKVDFAFTTDEWKEGLKYIKRFFDEGLIPKETLTQKSDQYNTLLYAEVPVVATFAGWCYNGTDVFRRNEYTYINALEGPDGEKRVMYERKLPGVASGAVITTDCENPDAAFLVLDYMLSEVISLTSRYGKQGVTWDFWEDAKVEDKSKYSVQCEGYDYDIKFVSYNDPEKGNFWNWSEPQNLSYRQTGPIIRDEGTVIGNALLTETSTEEERVRLENELITWDSIVEAQAMVAQAGDEYFDYAPLTLDEAASVADIQSAMKSYVSEMISAFLSGDKDIDAEWDTYMNELEKIGVNTLRDVYQTAYDRVH